MKTHKTGSSSALFALPRWLVGFLLGSLFLGCGKVGDKDHAKSAKPAVIQCTTDDSIGSIPVMRAGMPPPSLPVQYSAKKVEFELVTDMVNNKRLRVQALVPFTTDGLIAPTASDMVFYAPYLSYSNLHGRRDEVDSRILWELCERHGMTVFTLEFDTNRNWLDVPEKCYYYEESGSFQAAFAARDRLLQDFGLEKRRMYVIGVSGGGCMGQRMALKYPEEIASVAMAGGGRFAEVTGGAPDIGWLLLYTRGDTRASQGSELVRDLRVEGMNALLAECEPVAGTTGEFLQPAEFNFRHSNSAYGYELLREFIVAQAEMRSKAGGLSLLPQFWPMQAQVDTPQQVEPVRIGGAVSPNLPATLYFPSERFARLWKIPPYREFDIAVPSAKEGGEEQSLRVSVRYPASGVPPQGIVLFHSGENGLGTLAQDGMDLLGWKGWLAVSAAFSPSERTSKQEVSALLEWVLRHLPNSLATVRLIGFDRGGRHVLLAGADHPDPRVKEVIAVDAELDWPFPDLSPLAQRAKMQIPIRLGTRQMTLPEGAGVRKFQGTDRLVVLFARTVAEGSPSMGALLTAMELPDDPTDKSK